MQDHYDRLGLSPGATSAEIKAAYHAYETLRKPPRGEDDFFAPVPIQAELDQALLEQLKQRATAVVDVTLEDLIRLTF
jgi:hypothetical protein